MAVHPTLFVQAALPHSEVYADAHRTGPYPPVRPLASHYQRVNGALTLTVRAGLRPGPTTAHPPVSRGVPYGALGRLLLAHVVTEAKKAGSQTVDLGRTLAAFCDRLAITPSGGPHGRVPYLTDQLLRLATCTLHYEWENRPGYGAAPGRHRPGEVRGENLPVVHRYRFWHLDAGTGLDLPPPPPAPFSDRSRPFPVGGQLRLADDFWRDVARSVFPFDLRKAQLFRGHPTAYDLYLWLTYRLEKLDRDGLHRAVLSLDQLHAQLGSHYATDADGRLTPASKKEFGRAVRHALAHVCLAWPALRVETPRGRVVVHATGPDVRRR